MHKKKPTQYTVRSIPPELDKALRRLAREDSKSLNQVILEILRQGSLSHDELSDKGFTDLDHLAGKWEEDPAFDKAIKDQEVIESNEWKR